MKPAEQNVLARGLASLPSEANSKQSSATAASKRKNSHSTSVVNNNSEKKVSISIHASGVEENVFCGAEKKKTKKLTSFTPVDIDVLRSLEQDYQAVAKLGDVNDKALRIWNRRAAWISVFLVILYFAIGVVCFSYFNPQWDVPNTILFAVYSATSAGYGHLDISQTPAFQVFDIFFIMIGIAGVAIMFAQVYQFLSLEAQKAHHKRKASELASNSSNEKMHKKNFSQHFWRFVENSRPFFRETLAGRILEVFIPLCVILMSGALIIGSLEGWSFIECLYFGIASMTTVGYGDYYPTHETAVWICIFWLPFNVLFTSIYMGSVATAYLHFSANGVQRIRDRLKSEVAQETEFNRSISSPPGDESKRDRVAIDLGIYNYEDDESSMDPEDPPTLKTSDVCTSDQNDLIDDDRSDAASQDAPIFVLENMTATLTTMEDVVQAVHTYTEASLLGRDENGNDDDGANVTITESLGYLAVQPRSSRQSEVETESGGKSQPCFALRVLVNERLAHIIAMDIAGGNHSVDVQDACIVVRIGQWKNVVAKWNIPSGAWKAFRAAALNAIMLVGEHALIQHGAHALFRLSPDEFHSIFSPLVAALGDAETLEGWMKSTDALAKASFNREDNHLLTSQALELKKKKRRELTVADDMVQMLKGPGTAFHKN